MESSPHHSKPASAPFWILLPAAIYVYNGFGSFYEAMAQIFLQTELRIFAWNSLVSPLIRTSLGFSFAYGLTRGKNWVRILSILLSSIVLLSILAIFAFGILHAEGTFSLSNGIPLIMQPFILGVLLHFVNVICLTREPSRMWCSMPRPLSTNWKRHAILVGTLSLIGFQESFHYRRLHQNAYPVQTVIRVVDDVTSEPIPIDDHELYIFSRLSRSRSRATWTESYIPEEFPNRIHLRGVAFMDVPVPFRITNYEAETLTITQDTPSEVEVRLKKQP